MPLTRIKVVTINKPDVGWSKLNHAYNDETVKITKILEIIWLTRYPGWQEILMTMYLDVTIHKIQNIISLQWVLLIVSDNL